MLLNANVGLRGSECCGSVGARIFLFAFPPPNTLSPNESRTVEFRVGLQKREPFNLFVNMLGEPQSTTSSVSMR